MMRQRAFQALAKNAPPVQGVMLQRKCACGQHTGGETECEECKKKKQDLQRRKGDGSEPAGVPAVVHEALRSPGQPLDGSIRTFMERRFRHDFSSVRVHRDSKAVESAKAVNAVAYTVGRNIVFGAGHYTPETLEGKRLISHELTHVVQQAGSLSSNRAFVVRPQNDAFELEAEKMAESITADAATPIPISGSSLIAQTLQRSSLSQRRVKGKYTDDELISYLDLLDERRGSSKPIEGKFYSDNKAREIVRRFVAGDQGYNLDQGYKSLSSIDLKRSLIMEMLSGYRSNADMDSIIEILNRSTAAEIDQIMDPGKGMPLIRLMTRHGKRGEKLQAVLQDKLKLGDVDKDNISHSGNQPCDPLQTFVIRFAQKQARNIVENAVSAIKADLKEGAGGTSSVRAQIDSYFPGADEEFISKRIVWLYEQILSSFPTRAYACVVDDEAPIITPLQSKSITRPCFSEDAFSLVQVKEGSDVRTVAFEDARADPRTFFCPGFFNLSLQEQPVTVIHEWAHQAGRLAADPSQPPLKAGTLTKEVAVRNPESFARLAYILSQLAKAGGRPRRQQS